MLKLAGAVVVVLLVIVGVIVLRHSLTNSATPGVFNGITPSDLAGSGITIIDQNPTEQPTVPRDKATRSVLGQTGVTVASSQLVRIHIAPSESIPPKPSGYFLAWAIRLDTSRVANTEYFGTGLYFTANPTIAFVDATTGDYLSSSVVTASP
jgi:hypothetical protein